VVIVILASRILGATVSAVSRLVVPALFVLTYSFHVF